MISTKGRYSIRILLDLAEHRSGGYIPMKEVAARQNISLKYIEKLMPALKTAGFIEIGAHLTLYGAYGPVRVRDGLALCHLAHHTLAGLGEGDDGRVVLAPSAFAMTTASPPSMTATQLLVVPKSHTDDLLMIFFLQLY